MTAVVERTDFNKKIRKEFDRIQKSNKEFKRAGKKQKRVLAAKDAIRWTNLGLLNPSSGSYLVIGAVLCIDRPPEWWDAQDQGEIQLHEQILERVEEPADCTVCGVGGLLVAKCMRFDKYAVSYQFDRDMALETCEAGDGLADLFSNAQLALIECAFEQWTTANSEFGYISEEAQFKASEFGFKYNDAKERFIAIMRNIVKNEGTFKP